jgi:hypothetical protein
MLLAFTDSGQTVFDFHISKRWSNGQCDEVEEEEDQEAQIQEIKKKNAAPAEEVASA